MKSSLYIVLYLISNLFRTYDLHMLYDTFFQKKKIYSSYIGFAVYYLVISLEYILIDLPILTLLLNIIILFLVAFLYRPSVVNAIISTVFVMVLSCFSEAIVMLLSGYNSFSFMQTGFYASYAGVVAIPILLFVFCLIFRLIKRNNVEQSIPLSHSIITFSIPAACLFIMFQLFSFENVEAWQFGSIITLLLFLSFGTIWMYDRQLEDHEREEQQKLLVLQNQFFHDEIEHMTLFEESTKKIHHDIKNHLVAINILASNNKDTAVTDYIKNLLPDIQSENNYVYTGNMIINGICNYYISIAKKYNIDTTYYVAFPYDLVIDENDITILLGNLWNNCIENAKEAENPKIEFRLFYEKNCLIISTINNFSGARKKIKNHYITTKADTKHHGIGMKNMQQIINKYDGAMKIKCADNIFDVQILMYLS